MTKIQEYLETNKEELSKWLSDGEQGRIDLKILPHLKDIENGVFVEAGALDGLFMSNTKLLEDLGWTGLLVEPSAKACEKCEKNRKAIVENCALVSRDYKDMFVYGDFFFDGEDGMGAWSGIHKNAYGLKAARAAYATTLDRLLKHHKIGRVDFFSLDVEGYEMEVLKGIDFTTTDIRFILVEVNLDSYTLDDMNNYLGQFGYKNLGCLSGFTDDMAGWDGSHSDYLYEKS